MSGSVAPAKCMPKTKPRTYGLKRARDRFIDAARFNLDFFTGMAGGQRCRREWKKAALKQMAL